MTQDKPPSDDGDDAEHGVPTRPTFTQIVQTFAIQALIAAGVVESPLTGKTEIDPLMAGHNIAVLEVLEEKTRGNLDSEESEALGEALHRSRVALVAVLRQTPPE